MFASRYAFVLVRKMNSLIMPLNHSSSRRQETKTSFVTRVLHLGFLMAMVLLCESSYAAVLEYGDENLLGTGTYSSDPKSGATLSGLTTDQVTYASNIYPHSFPFSPAAGEYPGTDQIYVGSNQTGYDDGYSEYSGRLPGPQVTTMDYSSLIPVGQSVSTLTLGIAADDFQFPVWGNPFTASINGVVDTALTNVLNGLNLTGPEVQFLTIGIDPSILSSSNVLTLSIDEGGNGADGWAIDFLTIGVTTTTVPEPLSLILSGFGILILGSTRFQRRR